MGKPFDFPGGEANIQTKLTTPLRVTCSNPGSAEKVAHNITLIYDFKKTSPSVFTKANTQGIFAFLVQIDSNYLFSEDCNYSMLQFLRMYTGQNKTQFSVNDSFDQLPKEEPYREISWPNGINMTMFEDNLSFPTTILSYKEYWRCADKGTYTPEYPFFYPERTDLNKSLSKDEKKSYEDVLMNPIFVFSIIGLDTSAYWVSFLKGKSVKTKLEAATGDMIPGRSIDLDGDGIPDAFWYQYLEEGTGVHWYEVLYINIEGIWTPVWYTNFSEK